MGRETALSQLEGTIEEVVFRNQENGWTVLVVKTGRERVSAVGVVPDAAVGERARLEGEWVEHPDWGMQLRISSCELMPPDTRRGMERFLASGYVRGVGPATAKLIMQHFGKNAFEVLENEPHRLSEIPGIGPKRAAQIAEGYAARREMRQTMVFLQTYGLSAQIAAKIFKTYGPQAPDIVRRTPYRLVEDVQGVGFLTADAVARAIGVSPDDPGRIRAGILYAMEEAVLSSGHCYLPYARLCREAAKLLRIDAERVETAMRALVIEGLLVRRDLREEGQDPSEEQDAVYTARLYAAEGDVAQRLAALAGSGLKGVKGAREAVARYEERSGVTLSDEQRQAVLAAAEGGLTVVTGGPGTGKTTCIRCMLEALAGAGRTELCAPTGRAAKRMSEASGHEAKTIHRLLEYGGDEENFQRNADNPLEADVIIVDEVSMADLFLVRALLRACKQGVRLVLVGDADQLPPVGAGNVLADLIDSGVAPVIHLTRIYRQEDGSRIVENAHRINRGEMPLCNGKSSDFFFERCETAAEAAQIAVRLAAERLPRYLGADPMTAIQTMAPMKKGDAGVWTLNKRLQEALNPRRDGEDELIRGDMTLRRGDRVMQIRNDYQKEWTAPSGDGAGVFNGDIGFVTDVDLAARTVRVRFDEEREAEYDDSDLDDLELAYCMSVHKSQGGEFDAIILPLVSGPTMLMTRNLLYTAVTRAKKLVVLVGREQCVWDMVQNDHVARRYSALAARLRTLAEIQRSRA